IRRAQRFVWFFGLVLLCPADASTSRQEEHLLELVASESSLIDTLREYIDALDRQLELIRDETAAIEQIHGWVGVGQVEQYMGNPLNVLTILKRFQSNWPQIERLANETHELAESIPDLETELQLPSEEEYEAALLNLLRLQSIYELEPATLSLGIVNGLKLGSAMSWSDCLEMARTSDRNGEHAVAKYWLETALGKLPDANNATHSSSELQRGKVQILEASLNMDYRAGDFQSALLTAKELLLLRPASQNVHKAKARIERVLSEKKLLSNRKAKRSVKHDAKSAEQLLVNELCRAASRQRTAGSRPLNCRQDVARLRMLRLEPLSEDPHIMLYHDVLSSRQTEQLISSLADETHQRATGAAAFTPLRFDDVGKKLLRSVHYQLGLDGQELLGMRWQARRHSHEHVTAPEVPSGPTSLPQPEAEHAARAMLSLQESRLGGALAFPQLELGVNVPRGGLLHWRVRNGYDLRSDYRSRQLVCPVLLGVQL
ncbi:hypothetical protein KR222_003531, partial [Zaprionus bogoriensis]